MPGINNESPKKHTSYEMVNVEAEDLKSSLYNEGPLIKAAKSGDLSTLTSLLEKGENVTEAGEGGGTPLHWAANNDNFPTAIACCEELIRHALLNSNSSLLTTLLNFEDKIQQNPIFWAASKGNDRLVKIFLNNGSKLGVNFRNETLLHVVAQLKDTAQAELCMEILLESKYYDNNSRKLAEYLNIERKYTKWTALQMAAIAGHSLLLGMLIRAGADALKVDHVGRNVFHRSAGHAFEEKAVECTRILIQEKLTEDWNDTKSLLLHQFDAGGKCPIHIAARRGFPDVLSMLSECYAISEGNSGYTVLHSAANLGNQYKAESCVKIILDSLKDQSDRNQLLKAQDKDGCTPLYLAAANRNIEAAKILLLAGSAFDIRTKRGKTPLEKVYEKIPQAVNILLEEAVKNSGYVEHINSVNMKAQLDFGPILGYSTTKTNVYKETEELAKVCYAKFEDRKEILHNTFIKIYIYEKWKKIRWFFVLFRILHVLWFLANFYLLVSVYRVNCPYKNAKKFSWLSLRPGQDGDTTDVDSKHKALAECDTTKGLFWSGALNLVALFIYILSQFHATKQRLHWIFRPMKAFQGDTFWFERFFKKIGYYVGIVIRIFPCWPALLGTVIFFSTLPALGILVFDETCHYIIAGVLGLLIWLAIYMELGKVPRFRVYINLLKRSTQTLLWAIAVTAPILFGFATVFIVLMPGEPSFSSAAQSFVKIITFMIGELDYDGLFYGDGKDNIFSGFVMLALAIFIVIIVVLLVNFLIGLAAEEIRDFWERAEIWTLCTQLEQIVMLESFLDESVPICGKGILRRNLMLMPPERENDQIVKQRRKATIYIPGLPQKLQKELHELNLKTISQIR